MIGDLQISLLLDFKNEDDYQSYIDELPRIRSGTNQDGVSYEIILDENQYSIEYAVKK